MTFITAVETITPKNHYTTREILDHSGRWLGDDENREIFLRFIQSSHIESRAFALPLEKIFALNGVEQREEIFLREGRVLGSAVMAALMQRTAQSPEHLGGLVFTSCSVPTIPAVDTLVLQDLGFPAAFMRVPVYQYGCAGGAAGLSLACALSKQRGSMALLSVELCSLVYQGKDLSRGNLVGSALFADGGAAVHVSESGGRLRHIASLSHLMPESQHLMGYFIKDSGNHLRLDKDLPGRLLEVLPEIVSNFCSAHGVKKPDWWLFHPGGAKILAGLAETFALQEAQANFAWNVLRDHGNMSSASLLFVVKDFLESGKGRAGQSVLLVGMGPGLTIELLLFQVCA